MAKKCELCGESIEEEFGKLDGTILRVVNENKRAQFIYVCSACQQKGPDWIEKAKIKGA